MLQAIDAVDNGINQFNTEQPPRYVNNTHLSSRVGRLNLDWMDQDQSPEKENEAFQRAMALAGSEFLDVRYSLNPKLSFASINIYTFKGCWVVILYMYLINSCLFFLKSLRFHAKSWLPARSIVLECLAARQDIDPSGEIMVLDRFCPVSFHS